MSPTDEFRREIQRRQLIREEFGLPPIDEDEELARMEAVQRDRAFRQYVADNRDEYNRLWDEIARQYAYQSYLMGWLNTFSKMAIHARVLEIMKRSWRDER
jgi:hypothetical protein